MTYRPAAIGKEVRIRRRRLGMTQEKLAVKAAVSVTTLGKIENGQFTGQPYSLPRIADALDVPLAELLGNAIPSAPDPAHEHRRPAIEVRDDREARIVQRLLDELRAEDGELSERRTPTEPERDAG